MSIFVFLSYAVKSNDSRSLVIPVAIATICFCVIMWTYADHYVDEPRRNRVTWSGMITNYCLLLLSGMTLRAGRRLDDGGANSARLGTYGAVRTGGWTTVSSGT